MYAYIKGEDGHFCFKWFNKREEAYDWLDSEKSLYEICYKNPDYGVLTNKQFDEKFPEEEYRLPVYWRRLGNQLRERIAEVRSLRK